jgi:phage terminase Nu1 subunit (DNA packaging protein)
MANMVKVQDVCHAFIPITPRRYRQLAEEGHVPKPEKGMVDLLPTLRDYIAYQHQRLQGSGSLSLTDERTRLTKIQADRKEIELLKTKGELLPVRDTMAVWSAVIITMKTRLLGFPRKMAPIVYGCAKETEIQELLQREIDEICNELAEPDLRDIALRAGVAPVYPGGGSQPLQGKSKADRKRVGRSEPGAKPGGKRGTREVVHSKG